MKPLILFSALSTFIFTHFRSAGNFLFPSLSHFSFFKIFILKLLLYSNFFHNFLYFTHFSLFSLSFNYFLFLSTLSSNYEYFRSSRFCFFPSFIFFFCIIFLLNLFQFIEISSSFLSLLFSSHFYIFTHIYSYSHFHSHFSYSFTF